MGLKLILNFETGAKVLKNSEFIDSTPIIFPNSLPAITLAVLFICFLSVLFLPLSIHKVRKLFD